FYSPAHPLLCFFFFQAEDGIRDFHVTGVQTLCSSDLSSPPQPPTSPTPATGCPPPPSSTPPPSSPGSPPANTPPTSAPSSSTTRSEERRVGKECRSRWSPYHQKKRRRTTTHIQ